MSHVLRNSHTFSTGGIEDGGGVEEEAGEREEEGGVKGWVEGGRGRDG